MSNQEFRNRETIKCIERYFDVGKRARREEQVGVESLVEERLVAEESDLSDETIRKCESFAATFSKSELKTFLSLRTKDGRCLTWSHILPLLSVGDGEKRIKFAKQAARRGLDADRLGVLIRNGKPAHGGGRRLKPPATAADWLGGLAVDFARWNRKTRKCWQVELEELKIDHADRQRRTDFEAIERKIRRVAALMEEIASNAAALLPKLRSIARKK